MEVRAEGCASGVVELVVGYWEENADCLASCNDIAKH